MIHKKHHKRLQDMGALNNLIKLIRDKMENKFIGKKLKLQKREKEQEKESKRNDDN